MDEIQLIEHETWTIQQEYWIQMRKNAELENLILSKKLMEMIKEE